MNTVYTKGGVRSHFCFSDFQIMELRCGKAFQSGRGQSLHAKETRLRTVRINKSDAR